MTGLTDPQTIVPASNPRILRRRQSRWGLLSSPLLWGAVLTIAVYQAVPYLPFFRSSVQRYLCSHPLEYTLVGLFCIGITILLQKAVQLRRESIVLKADPLFGIKSDAGIADIVVELDRELARFQPRFRETHFLSRLTDVCQYVRSRHSGSGLESHLKYLAELSADRVHESYSLLQTINWAVPIIGFLGTVVGITLAIAKVTPEQLDSSLNDVTGGLAIAFDTTTVALSFSLVLVFGYQLTRRAENAVLEAVEEIGLQHLLPLLGGPEATRDPIHQAQAEAARQLLERTDALIHEQTHLWRHSMDGLRQRWSDTLASQQQQLSDHLTSGMQSSLADHAGQLQAIRSDFLQAFEQAADHIVQAVGEDASRRELHVQLQQRQFADLWQQMQAGLQETIRIHDSYLENTFDGLTERIADWQRALEEASSLACDQLQKLQEHTGLLTRLADQEEHLARLQQQLTLNLEAVRTAETFEQSLNHLTAAVHLLTARTRHAA